MTSISIETLLTIIYDRHSEGGPRKHRISAPPTEQSRYEIDLLANSGHDAQMIEVLRAGSVPLFSGTAARTTTQPALSNPQDHTDGLHRAPS